VHDPDEGAPARVLEQPVVEPEEAQARECRGRGEEQLRSHCDLQRGLECGQGDVVNVAVPAVRLVGEEHDDRQAAGKELPFPSSACWSFS
jgi:hypothetical protein